MTPDWSGSPVLVPYADLGNPQTFNLYSYVANNPLNTVDPEGHFRLNPPGSFVPYHDPDTGGLYGEVTPWDELLAQSLSLKRWLAPKIVGFHKVWNLVRD